MIIKHYRIIIVYLLIICDSFCDTINALKKIAQHDFAVSFRRKQRQQI
jgi:hypothetical protein